MQSTSQLDLIAQRGIADDVNANPISPRQLLVVRQEDLIALAIEPGTLRENIVVEHLAFDHFIPGTKLILGKHLAIRLMFYCEPCKQVKPLVTSLKQLEKRRGILGVVLTNGRAKIGQSIHSLSDNFSPLSDVPYERFLTLLNRIPSGKVITYRQVIQAIGVTHSYYRVLPRYLKMAATQYPSYRVVDSKGYLVSHLPHQATQLTAEGVTLMPDQTRLKVRLELDRWQMPAWG